MSCILALLFAIIFSFHRISIANTKMKRFYNLLVRDSMDPDPDLDKLRKDNAADIKAIRNEFQNSKSFKINLAFACVTKLILSILFGIWILYISYGTIYTDDKPQPTINDGIRPSEGSSKFSFIDYIKCTIAEVSESNNIMSLNSSYRNISLG